MASKKKLNVFDALTMADFNILKELDNAHDDHQKKLDIYTKRIDLYQQCANGIPDPIIQAIIQTKKSVIMNEIAIINTQHTLQEDIAKAFSRLDDLEAK